MRRLLFPALLTLTLILSACSAAPAPAPIPTVIQPASTPMDPFAPPPAQAGDLSRVDEQGMVVIEVKPLNLDASAGDLEFAVSMDTHSVDLGMDLAPLSTLTSDTGVTVQATLWDAPRGGHHVSGRLTFPAEKNGKSILAGASKLTLTISNVDAPARTFEWTLR